MTRPNAALLVLVVLGGCSSAAPQPVTGTELDARGALPEVVVSSIDAVVRPGPALRQARLELTREGASEAAGFMAVALTGDPAAVDIIVRALARVDSCEPAAEAIALLPRRLARRALWLALRLECSSETAQRVAAVLELDPLVAAAREAGELAPSPLPATAAPTVEGCDERVETIAELEAEGPLPPALARLVAGSWRLPQSTDELCDEPVLAAAARLRRGDPTVQLALDLVLNAPEALGLPLVAFVEEFDLGGVTPRLEARVDEAEGRVCAALVRAGRLDGPAMLLAETAEAAPACLLPAARALAERDDAEAIALLEAIARTGPQPGCAPGALVAARALADRGVTPPRWTADPTALGRALAALLERRSETELEAALTEARAVARRFGLIEEPPGRADGPVRLLQRDLHELIPRATGSRRAAFEELLEEGRRPPLASP